MKPNASPREKSGSLRRNVVIAVVVAAVALTAILVFALRGNADPAAQELPPDERFIRETVVSFDPNQSTLQRLESVRTALTTLKELPQTRREEVIIEAMATGINRNLENFRALPDAEKPARAKLLYEDALQTRKFFRNLPPEDRRRARELLGGEAKSRAQLDRAVNTVINVMTPEERTMLNPVFVVWKSMLEER